MQCYSQSLVVVIYIKKGAAKAEITSAPGLTLTLYFPGVFGTLTFLVTQCGLQFRLSGG